MQMILLTGTKPLYLRLGIVWKVCISSRGLLFYRRSSIELLGKLFLGTKAVFTSWTTKIIFHISLLALTTTFVLLDNYQWGSYNRASAAVSCRYFLPNDRVCDFDTCMTSLTTSYPTLEPYSCSLFTVSLIFSFANRAKSDYSTMIYSDKIP